MARYNKIFAGPATQVTPQVAEVPASVAIIPGSIVVLTADKYALAGVDTVGKVYIAQDKCSCRHWQQPYCWSCACTRSKRCTRHRRGRL